MHTLENQQQALLRALWAPGESWRAWDGPDGLKNYIAENTYPSSARGINSYKSNAHALAERVLGAAYPVVTAVLSTDSMAQLARALWHAHPPTRGDLAHWGDALPDFMADSPQLASLPWLPDLARVEWALHRAEGAPDAGADIASLQLLAEQDPGQLTLRLAPGLQVLETRFAVVRIWQAHRQATRAEQDTAIEQLGPRWSSEQTEHALVWRVGHQRPQLQTITAPEGHFLVALQTGQNLLAALEGCDLDFSVWLPQALQHGVVLGAHPT